ncbi:hypothetical protein AB0945_17640 [Streptomyces sp. NPDC005474]|uniref:hypothetical protein n=1 Tax=Streptomyces sp. NPDC005474 TaxID=3154878 RepID=UPI0034567852
MPALRVGVLAGVVAALVATVGITTAASATSGAGTRKPVPTAVQPLTGTPVSVPAGGYGYATVACPAGTLLSGGGGTTSGYNMYLTDSYASGSSWIIRGTNTGTSAANLTAYVVCL